MALDVLTHPRHSSLQRFFMGFFRHFRSKSSSDAKVRSNVNGSAHRIANGNANGTANRAGYYNPSASGGIDWTNRLPHAVLQRIFSFVCPHSSDSSYDCIEDVDLDTCFLCDLRDLANCVRVRRTWYAPASQQLYRSIRLDQIHYCYLEDELKEQRRKKNKRRTRRRDDDYVYNPETDVAVERLHLLVGILRDNSYLSGQVLFIKLPYLLRTSGHPDLARLVQSCPNLRYVDLPDEFYRADLSTSRLRLELTHNCRNLRFMKYYHGSGQKFEQLKHHNPWTNLEHLTLDGISVDHGVFRQVISRMKNLNTLILTSMPGGNDDLFSVAFGLPEIPPVRNLELHDLPDVTIDGVLRYLLNQPARDRLRSLTMDGTGVEIADLHKVLANAHSLLSLTVIYEPKQSLPLDPLPPLASLSLQNMHFEIKDNSHQRVRHPPGDSYHRYLADSILDLNLPSLRALYVREPRFPQALLSPNPPSARTSIISNRNSVVSTIDASQLNFGIDAKDHMSMAANPFLSVANYATFGSHSQPASARNSPSPPALTSPAFLQQDPFARHARPTPRRRPLQQPLEVFTKSHGDDLGEWLSRPLDPSPPPGASPRPMSTFNAGWAASARRSVIVGDGEGHWAEVPDYEREASRPSSRASMASFRSENPTKKKRRSRFEAAKVGDLWG
ncbi:hypothetical protein BT63DRAFT_422018 [Microthyrium microscopicum]|uniref:F-box domain-containing protein n=1 Tax=Microthyrium microscopicum TaxID=703497 RepID=A0A6A6USJ9_9PEZI|nr:hypothetical protein BT63DRAFT_422018 [Microthyrium microscopicum]